MAKDVHNMFQEQENNMPNKSEYNVDILNAYDEEDDEPEETDQGATFASNAMRSEHKLPYWRFPTRAMQEWAKRFAKGMKYDAAKGITHNWKLGINSGDLEYIREFFNHATEHLLSAKDRAQFGPDIPDHEGETMFDHLGAAMWNIASLIEYLDKDPSSTCKALDQTPQPMQNL